MSKSEKIFFEIIYRTDDPSLTDYSARTFRLVNGINYYIRTRSVYTKSMKKALKVAEKSTKDEFSSFYGWKVFSIKQHFE